MGFSFGFNYYNSTTITNITGPVQNFTIVQNESSVSELVLSVRNGSAANGSDSCRFTITSYAGNSTIYARSSAGCNFSTSEQPLLNTYFDVPLSVSGYNSSLDYGNATLRVVILDTYVDLRCSLTSAMLADKQPYRYRQQYGYFVRCDGIYTSLTSVQGTKTADNLYFTSVPTSLEVLGCTALKCCWTAQVQLANDSLLDYDPASAVASYPQYAALPLFSKNNLVRALLSGSGVSAARRDALIGHVFADYAHCVRAGAAGCHQGLRFPYTVQAYELAAAAGVPGLQACILDDYFSEAQLGFVRQLSGLAGSDYLDTLVAFARLRPASDAALMRRHLALVLRHVVYDEGVQLGFNALYTLGAADASFALLLQDFMHCQAANAVDFAGLRYEVRTRYTHFSGCGDKLG